MSAPQLTAVERLALSRERLRVALAHTTPAPGPSPTTAGTGLLDILKATLPGASAVIDTLGSTLKQWWARHPLHTSALLASSVVQTLLRPVAQRHPVALVTSAVVLGAALALSRPWRWAFKPHFLSALGPSLLSSVLASDAVQSWLAAVLTEQAPANDDARSN